MHACDAAAKKSSKETTHIHLNRSFVWVAAQLAEHRLQTGFCAAALQGGEFRCLDDGEVLRQDHIDNESSENNMTMKNKFSCRNRIKDVHRHYEFGNRCK